MAHRPMPHLSSAEAPAPAKTTPLQRLPEPIPLPVAGLSEKSKKHSLDYWTVIFAILVGAAILLVAWRLGKIFWGIPMPSATQKQTAVTNPYPPVSTPTRQSGSQAVKSSDAKLPHRGASAQHTATEEAGNDVVVVRAIVGIDGKVKQATIVRGSPALASVALRTVRQLSFTPYTRNGTPIEFETDVAVSARKGSANSQDKIQISVPQ